MPKPESKLSLELLDKLRRIELPEGWQVLQLTVQFKRPNKNAPIDSCYVTYDSKNDQFYAQTAKGYIYPNEIQEVKESIKVMQRANEVLKGNTD